MNKADNKESAIDIGLSEQDAQLEERTEHNARSNKRKQIIHKHEHELEQEQHEFIELEDLNLGMRLALRSKIISCDTLLNLAIQTREYIKNGNNKREGVGIG